jgi:phosphopantetheinyl transferase
MLDQPLHSIVQIDILFARISKKWTAELNASWCPRANDLASMRREDQIRSLAADKLLTKLCHRWGAPMHHYLFTGQPVPDSRTFHLSASHDADCVLAGASNHFLGVDVVALNRKVDWMERMLCVDERNHIQSESINRSYALCAAWAVREATLKYMGIGLFINPRSLTVSLLKGCKKQHYAQVVSNHVDKYLWEVTMNGRQLAVVATGSPDDTCVFAVAFKYNAWINFREVNICATESF